jgi:DNA-binding response OmpR family regulator
VVIIPVKQEVAAEVIGLVGRENFFAKPFDPDAVIARLKALAG